ncbi:zinc finger protein GAI-ASSOCIATED FACTOR 1-like, partial [Andrographis paniculata]|uniref:zinc finger protein GAI-ASSOCIATED FACTOR 1-like n=1 Tax=Andrographis paniculata TaxID=175694 RepID=UPI0021E74F4A
MGELVKPRKSLVAYARRIIKLQKMLEHSNVGINFIGTTSKNGCCLRQRVGLSVYLREEVHAFSCRASVERKPKIVGNMIARVGGSMHHITARSPHLHSQIKQNLKSFNSPHCHLIQESFNISRGIVTMATPRTLLATNQYVCEICHKAFQRDQNLQLYKRAHNLPARLERSACTSGAAAQAPKKVYICPETSCVHHNPARVLGDLTGIRKHYRRKICEKRWNCTKCSKKYAVESDWKAHCKTFGTKEYNCGCGIQFTKLPFLSVP